jgi:hypothetical protein
MKLWLALVVRREHQRAPVPVLPGRPLPASKDRS